VNFSASASDADGGHVLLYHRPHSFALMHGDGGAKIAYGQLLWRVDNLDFHFDGNSVSGSSGPCSGAGQTDTLNRPIKGLEVVIPTVGSPDGPAMDPTIPNIYHELDAWGDVYLYWKVDLSVTEILTECWVEVTKTVDGEEVGATDVIDIRAVAIANTDHDRFAGAPLADEDIIGVYRVKLGTVNKKGPALITQDISSDVYWSTVVLTRNQIS